jgi:hypothetical protein
MKIIGVLAISLVVFSICCFTCAKEISGGPHVVVIGNGQNSSSGSAPELNPVTTPSSVYNDPSRYSSPGNVNYTIPTTDNQENQTILNTSTSISPFLFASISTVNGTGNFSFWRSLGEFYGVKSKQRSNGENGTLDSDNRLILANEVEISSTPRSNKSIIAVSRDVVKFSGMSYRDSENYNNDLDRIATAFDVTGISKESFYFGRLSYFHSPEDYKEFDNWTSYNKSFIYNLGVVYIGTSSFDSKIGSENGSEISEQYRGTFALNRRLSNKETFGLNQTMNESCIPCNIFNEEWMTDKKHPVDVDYIK